MLTVKNENIGNSDLEKVLRDKMNELSDSVDCFDKISARAFPEKDPNFSESGYTVSDVENITGRRDHGRILRWAAFAAAVVLCIVFIPKTGIVRHVLSNLGGSVTREFQQLITEINEETEANPYHEIDVPLEYYLKNDVLVTPLFSCPFEDCGKDDVMVRIYIRQAEAAYFSFDTAQVYAVEYRGEYCDNNIIAAAKSAYSFTDEDLIERFLFSSDTTISDVAPSALEQNFTPDKDKGCLIDSDGEPVSAASLDYGCFIRDGSDTVFAYTTIIYGHKGCDSSDEYFYDCIAYGNGKAIELPEREDMWERSLYYNGSSAFPKVSETNFTRTELFTREADTTASSGSFGYVGPFNGISYNATDLKAGHPLSLSSSLTNSIFSTVDLPSDEKLFRNLRVYYSKGHFTEAAESDSNGTSRKSCINILCDWQTVGSYAVSSSDPIRIKPDNELEMEREALNVQQEQQQAELEAMREKYKAEIEQDNAQLETEKDAFERDKLHDEISFREELIAEIEEKLGSDE